MMMHIQIHKNPPTTADDRGLTTLWILLLIIMEYRPQGESFDLASVYQSCRASNLKACRRNNKWTTTTA